MAQTTVTLQPDETTGIDTQIRSATSPTFNYGLSPLFQVGNTGGALYRTLFKFDLSSLPVDAVILSATLKLYCTAVSTSNSYPIYIHRSLVPFFEGNQNHALPAGGEDASTWNLKNANGSVAWGAVGGQAGTDYKTNPTARTYVTVNNTLYSFDVTPDVNDFHEGLATNNGWWAIGDEPINNTRKEFAGFGYATSGNRPLLEITYFQPEENNGTLVLQPEAGNDTQIYQASPNTNYETYIWLQPGYVSSNQSRGLIKFDLSSLPVGAQVSSAILSLYHETETSTTDATVNIHRSLVEFFEATSTWNHRNTIGSVTWGAAGGLAGTDYDATLTDAEVIANPATWYSFDVTSDVINFISGAYTNHGWWLRFATTVSNNLKQFASSDNPVRAFHPKLTLLYTFEADVAPDPVNAVGTTVNPTILSGTTITSSIASAVGVTVNPTVEIGGETFTGAVASAVGATTGGAPNLAMTGIISAVGTTVAPTTVKGSMVITPNAAEAIGDIGGFASLVDRTLRPAAATAIGETVGRVVALRIYPQVCDPLPLLYITDGTVKENGQLHRLNLLDRDNGFILNTWRPNVAQYKGGGVFSDNPNATGRRLSKRVFANAIEVMELKIRAHDQDDLVFHTKEYFSWQEMAADYWTSDWADRPVYLVAKAAKETNIRYAVIHMMSCPELENPYSQPFFDRSGKATMESITFRIERGDWCSTPPGEAECVEVSGVRSWTVQGWVEGDTTGGGGDETVTGDVLAMIQANNGDIIIGTNDEAKIFRSTDSGQTWVYLFKFGTSLSPTDSVNAIAKDHAGNLYAAVTGSAAAQGIWKSTTNGVGWTRVKTHPAGTGYNDIAFVFGNSTLVAVGGPTANTSSPITISIDSGATWTHPSTPHYYYDFMSVASFDTPGLITLLPGAPGGPEAFFGTDSFYTIAGRASRSGGGYVKETSSGQMGNGGLDMAAFGYRETNGNWGRRALWAVKSAADVTDTEIWQWPNPANATDSFGKIATIDGKLFNVLYVDPTPDSNSAANGRTVWAGANGEVYVSYNSGYSWSLATTAPVNQIRSFVRTTSGTLLAGGDNGEIFIFSGTSPTEGGGVGGGSVGGGSVVVNSYALGREATCEDEVYVGNKSSFTNITHVLHYNGSTYSELQFATDPPYTLLGTNPTTNKAAYFGSKTSDANVPGGTFSNVVFDITQIAENITVVWEYWNGSAWTALTAQDSSNGFRVLGVGSVHWVVPANWATTTVNGTLGYWVRARISAVAASPVYPIHSNRFIYTANLPYVEIDEDEVHGDIPAMAQIRWHNRSDNPTGSIELEMDRLICGLRSRGEFFNAYLNVSDVQTPFGFTLTKHAESSWATVVRAPTSRALLLNITTGGLLNTWIDLASFSISNSIAKDFYGTYRVFLRCYKSGSGTNNWQLRVRTSFGSGGSNADSKIAFPSTFNDWEMLDLGQISVPTTQVSQVSGNLGDLLKLTIQGKTSATGIALYLYDLVLIPTDEWAADVRSPELSEADTAKVKGGNLLDLDSITNPKVSLSAFNRNTANQIISHYQAVNNGPAIMQHGGDQRYWFLAASYENYWRSSPEIAGSVQLFKQQRYLGYRGRD